jgi:hypothetical protein
MGEMASLGCYGTVQVVKYLRRYPCCSDETLARKLDFKHDVDSVPFKRSA